MKERRNNWKQNLGKAAQARHNKRIALLTKLDAIREQLSKVHYSSDDYNELKAQQRETAAQLATL